MYRKITTIVFICFATILFAQKTQKRYNLQGTVIDSRSKEPIEFAVVSIPEINYWATTNEKGEFTLTNVPKGTHQLQTHVLGYNDAFVSCEVNSNIEDLQISLQFSSLALKEVIVTAVPSKQSSTTSYNINEDALQHMQLLNIKEIASLLPGGQTSRQNTLMGASIFALRSSESGESDNPTFGTGVELDGMRISNNATFARANHQHTYGIDTRNIASSNIESVEVITGIPSVEYGDISNGIVKIKTREGKSPIQINIATNINTKQIAINKGIALGKNRGIINLSLEHAKSISDIASPYTAYQRDNLSLKYSNTFNKKNKKPIIFSALIDGSIAGSNSKHDPDAFRDTFSRQKDNSIRASINSKWHLNLPWITNLSISSAYIYSNKDYTQKINKSSSASSTSLHGKDEGYFVATQYDKNPEAHALIVPPGYWYEILYEDNQPLDLSMHIKASLFKRLKGKLYNNTKIGLQYSSSRNLGRGYYYEDLRLAPTWREFRYDEVPAIHNCAYFAENKTTIPINKHKLEWMMGVRADITSISKSEYGTVNSFSPRLNLMFQTKYDNNKFVQQISTHAGYGKMVKLPSFNVLYPKPYYIDILTFTPGTMHDGTTYYAYHTKPTKVLYNNSLKWQKNHQFDIGLKATLRGNTKISLSAFYNKTQNPYKKNTIYTPFSYKFTGQSALENSPVPSKDRIYSVDQTTGIVTVADKTGMHTAYELAYTERDRFRGTGMTENGTPVKRMGLEWIVDFGKIKSLNTALRVDGVYYYYKSTDERMIASTSSLLTADGNHYKYIGFYKGGPGIANGSISKECRTNVTLTHIIHQKVA